MNVVSIDAFHLKYPFEPSCACIGYFDGIHKGHKELLLNCIEQADKNQLKKVCITFDPDPWVIFKNEKQKHLSTLSDKIQILSSYGFDEVYILQFSKEFASLSIESFHHLLKEMNIKILICGFDFKYGQFNSGNVDTLKKQNDFKVIVIDSVNFSNLKISTSRIEPLILKGELYQANVLLDYIYSISGYIEHGFKRGTNVLKIPTANLNVDQEYILPKTGVYAGMVLLENQFYKAMINIGTNPTFNNQHLTIEAHILDFDEDIYGQKIRFFFYDRIRDEMKFHSIDELKNQLLRDIQYVDQLNYDECLLKNTRNIFFKN